MTTEKITQWIQCWDNPIGALIEMHTDFDRDFTAHLQAQLLAIHLAEEKAGIDAAGRTKLFPLLSAGASAIDAKVSELGSDADETAARAIVDSNKGMPRDVPTFGLIAKVAGLVTPEVCDQLLVVQAAARIVKNSTLAYDTVPTLADAVNAPLYAHVGKNDKEPEALRTAQSFAHLALIHEALLKEAAVDVVLKDSFSSVAHCILNDAKDTLGKLGMTDAAADIDAVLGDIAAPKNSRAAAMAIAAQFGTVEGLMANQPEDIQRLASVIAQRTALISSGNGKVSGAPQLDL